MLLRRMFFLLIVRPLIMVVLGVNVRGEEKLPCSGPAVIVANHNSHLDTLVLMGLMPVRLLPKLRPVAAEDYFMRNRWIAWFAQRIIGIIPIARRRGAGGHDDPLKPVSEALERGEIVIIFPEGSRGDPERLGEFKSGVAHLSRRHPEVPVYPVFMHGLGKSLPRGEALFVPFFCDVFVGDPFRWCGDKREFMEVLTCRMTELSAQMDMPPWE